MVVLLSIAITSVLHLGAHGLDLVGSITSGLPSLGLPDVSGHHYLDLFGPAAGLMLVGFAEGLGAAKTYAAKEGYDIDSNRELVALGVSNLGCRPDQRHGRERQPVQDRGERRRRARARSSPG